MKGWSARLCGCHVLMFLSHFQERQRRVISFQHTRGTGQEQDFLSVFECLAYTYLRQIDALTHIAPFWRAYLSNDILSLADYSLISVAYKLRRQGCAFT